MRHRLMFIAGVGAGYVLGARAGRQAYDRIVDRARGLKDDPRVLDVAAKARGLVQSKGASGDGSD